MGVNESIENLVSAVERAIRQNRRARYNIRMLGKQYVIAHENEYEIWTYVEDRKVKIMWAGPIEQPGIRTVINILRSGDAG